MQGALHVLFETQFKKVNFILFLEVHGLKNKITSWFVSSWSMVGNGPR